MTFTDFSEQCREFFNKHQLDGTASDLGTVFLFEPNTDNTGGERVDFFHGLQLSYFVREQLFEVSEYQAGDSQDLLHIFNETPYFKVALKNLIKGNKRKPIRVW